MSDIRINVRAANKTGLPTFRELPERDGLRSSWGVWPGRERLGALNLLTDERRRAAAREVVTGRTFPLDLSQSLPSPPLFGREPFGHRIHPQPGAGGVGQFQDDLLEGWNTQNTTQWDGFRHVSREGHGYYGGLANEDHGIQHWAERGIVGRAVVADVARWRAARGRPLRCDRPDAIEAEELRSCLADQGSEVEPGDILLVRTGWSGWYRELDAAGRAVAGGDDLQCPGLRAGNAMAELLWDLHVSAVAGDNPCLEPWPLGVAPTPPGEDGASQHREQQTLLHVRLLPMLGIPIGELFDLEQLAQDCATDGRWSCLFMSAPLNFLAAAATPGNALALR